MKVSRLMLCTIPIHVSHLFPEHLLHARHMCQGVYSAPQSPFQWGPLCLQFVNKPEHKDVEYSLGAANSRPARAPRQVMVPPFHHREWGMGDIWEKPLLTRWEEVICSGNVTDISVLGQASLSLTHCATTAVPELWPHGSGTEVQGSWPRSIRSCLLRTHYFPGLCSLFPKTGIIIAPISQTRKPRLSRVKNHAQGQKPRDE